MRGGAAPAACGCDARCRRDRQRRARDRGPARAGGPAVLRHDRAAGARARSHGADPRRRGSWPSRPTPAPPCASTRLAARCCRGWSTATPTSPFAGWRAEEYEQKVTGVPYEQIARAGGGIASSARALAQATTRRCSSRRARLVAEMLAHGTTAYESKTGYGRRCRASARRSPRRRARRRPRHRAVRPRRPAGLRRRRVDGRGRRARRGVLTSTRSTSTSSRSPSPTSTSRGSARSPRARASRCAPTSSSSTPIARCPSRSPPARARSTTSRACTPTTSRPSPPRSAPPSCSPAPSSSGPSTSPRRARWPTPARICVLATD